MAVVINTCTSVTNLLVCLVDPRPVGALELQGDVLLLGGDQLLVARLHELRLLLVLDRRQASAIRFLYMWSDDVYFGVSLISPVKFWCMGVLLPWADRTWHTSIYESKGMTRLYEQHIYVRSKQQLFMHWPRNWLMWVTWRLHFLQIQLMKFLNFAGHSRIKSAMYQWFCFVTLMK